MQKRTIFVFILLTFLAACSSTGSDPDATPTPIPTPIVPSKPVYEIQRGDIVREVEFAGRISPVEEKELFFRESGYIKNVYVSKGDTVSAGQVIAELENLSDLARQKALSEFQVRLAELDLADAELALEMLELSLPDAAALQEEALQAVIEAEKAVQAAQLTYNRTLTTASQSSIDGAYAQTLLAENALENAKKAFESYADKPVTNLTRITLQSALAAAQQEYDAAVRTYNALTGTMSDLDQALAASNLELAQIALTNAQAEQSRLQSSPFPPGYAQELVISQNAVERAQIYLELTRLNIEDLEDAISDSQILAPFDGQILFLGLSEGRPVEAYERAVIVADTTELEIRAELTGSELDGLTQGMTVQVELFNAPGDPTEGIIRQLPSFSSPSDGSSSETDTFTRIQLNAKPTESGFELNDRVRVRVILEQKEDVLWLPPQAVRSFEGRNFVVIQDEGGQRRIDIKLGLRTGDRVEIVPVEDAENVSEGQVVVGP